MRGGVEVDTQGDAFFVAFPTAPGAVAAVADAQAALEPGAVSVRMGLHTGSATVTPEGYVGIDVHRGARLAALAHGGQVLLSEATASLLGPSRPLCDLGRHRLKDFDAPARLFQLGSHAFPLLRSPGTVDLPVPVTPFVGRDQELFEAVGAVLDRDPRVLTIVGPGGTGQTRFAIELGRASAAITHEPDWAWWESDTEEMLAEFERAREEGRLLSPGSAVELPERPPQTLP